MSGNIHEVLDLIIKEQHEDARTMLREFIIERARDVYREQQESDDKDDLDSELSDANDDIESGISKDDDSELESRVDNLETNFEKLSKEFAAMNVRDEEDEDEDEDEVEDEFVTVDDSTKNKSLKEGKFTLEIDADEDEDEPKSLKEGKFTLEIDADEDEDEDEPKSLKEGKFTLEIDADEDEQLEEAFDFEKVDIDEIDTKSNVSPIPSNAFRDRGKASGIKTINRKDKIEKTRVGSAGTFRNTVDSKDMFNPV